MKITTPSSVYLIIIELSVAVKLGLGNPENDSSIQEYQVPSSLSLLNDYSKHFEKSKSPAKIHGAREIAPTNPKPLIDLINDFHDSVIHLITVRDSNSDDFGTLSNAEFKTPIYLQEYKSLDLEWCSSNSSLDKKYRFGQIFLFLFPLDVNASIMETVAGYFVSTYDLFNPGDTSFREIIYLFRNTSGERIENYFQFDKGPINDEPNQVLNSNIVSNEIYVGILASENTSAATLAIISFYYVCKHCEYDRRDLYPIKMWTPSGLRNEAQRINQDGLNYIWTSTLRSGHRGNEPTIPPYLSEIILGNVIKNSEPTVTLDNYILKILFTPVKWLNRTYARPGKYPTVMTQITTYPDPYLHRVVLETGSYNFITCNGVSTGAINFGAYLIPFDKWSWITIALTLIVAPLVCAGVLYKVQGVPFKSTFWLIFEALTFSLVNQYPRGNGRNISSNYLLFMFRTTWGTFLIMAIVLVNGYIGLVITDITAPLPQTNRWETLEQVKHSKILTLFVEDNDQQQWLKYLRNTNKFGVGENWFAWTKVGEEFINFCSLIEFYRRHDRMANTTKFCEIAKPLLNQIEGVFKEELVSTMSNQDCNSMVVYLTPKSQIDYELADFKNSNPRNPYYKGKDEIFPHPQGWKISKQGGAMRKRFGIIVSSGIYNMFKHLLGFRKFFEMGRIEGKLSALKKMVKAQNLESNGAVVFYLYIICMAISILSFMIEKCYKSVL